MFSHVAPTEINSSGCILNRKSFVNGTGVGTPIADVENDTSREATGVQAQHARRVEEKLGYLKDIEEGLRCLDSVSNWVVRGLCQQHWVFSRVDLELIEDMSPDGLHIVPVLDHAVLHRVRQLQNAAEFLLFSGKQSCETLQCWAILTACCPM